MTTCVCVSGQVRGDTRSLERMADAFAGTDAQFIFSLWNQIGYKRDGAMNYSQLTRLTSQTAARTLPCDVWDHRFAEFAHSLFLDLEKSIPVVSRSDIERMFPSAVIDIEDDVLELAFERKNVNDTNSARMYYKIWRANKIKRKLERRNGQRYSTVVRSRPDITLTPRCLDAGGVDLKSIIFTNGFDGVECGDTFAISTSENLDIYAELFPISQMERTSPWVNTHHLLTKHLLAAGLRIERWARSPLELVASQIPHDRYNSFLESAAQQQDPIFSAAARQALAGLALERGDITAVQYWLDADAAAPLVDIPSSLWLAAAVLGTDAYILAGLTYAALLGSPTFPDNESRRFLLFDCLKAGLDSGVDLLTSMPNFVGDHPRVLKGISTLESLGGLTNATQKLRKLLWLPKYLRETAATYSRAGLFERAMEMAQVGIAENPNEDWKNYIAYLNAEMAKIGA